MSNNLQPVRGTKDLVGDDAALHKAIISKAEEIAALSNFKHFSTPIFEFTDVFKRTLGDTSDVVNKEMYSFEDRSGNGITLRPEFTAGIARAFISNGLQQNLPLKLFSTGPLFRYERPQKGRQRQFHQLNFEHLGDANPLADVEIINMGYSLLKSLGITEGLSLELNSLGDAESRAAYRAALVEYFSKYEADLSENSKNRLQNNPLRILDSKDSKDKEICQEAPKLQDYYTSETNEFFVSVKSGLEALEIPYQVNPHIVRGLDYYSHTVFEFIVKDGELGAQNTVLAGGRYDGLIEQMGGPQTPAIGFAAGIERLALLTKILPKEAEIIAILPETDEYNQKALKAAALLRANGLTAEIYSGGNFSKRMKKASKKGAKNILVLGQGEPSIRSDSHESDEQSSKIKEILAGL